MKNYKSLFAFVFLFSIAFLTKAQTTPAPVPMPAPAPMPAAPMPAPAPMPVATAAPNYFLGNWDVLVKGTPNGDVVIPMRFEMKDGKMKGYFTSPETKAEAEMPSADATNDELNVAFNIAGYDVTVKLTKKDDDHANGKLMDMFDAEGTRKK